MKNVINASNLFSGAFVPNWLLNRKEIDLGSKVLYGRLFQNALDRGYCIEKYEVLQEQIGIKSRNVFLRYLHQLEDKKLIKIENLKDSEHIPKIYFLKHEWMKSSLIYDEIIIKTYDIDESKEKKEAKKRNVLFNNNNNIYNINTKEKKKKIKKEKKNDDPVEISSTDYCQHFQEAWKWFPKREGFSPKRLAHTAWKKRIKSKTAHEDILRRIMVYNSWCTENNINKTKFVLQMKTFLQNDDYFYAEWELKNVDKKSIKKKTPQQIVDEKLKDLFLEKKHFKKLLELSHDENTRRLNKRTISDIEAKISSLLPRNDGEK